MLIDKRGQLLPKNSIIFLFMGLRQLIFAKDERCTEIIEVCPLEDFYAIFFKGDDETCKTSSTLHTCSPELDHA